MLINSLRLTDRDRAVWAQLERYDAALARDPRLNRLQHIALQHIHQWRHSGPGVCSVSWGKDSTVTAHLVALAGLDIPLVRVRYDPWEMPETDLVRDAFLATHDVRYQERRGVAALSVRRGDAIEPESQRHINHLGEQINERYISGVRAEESTTRTLSMARHGAVTTNTCRPIARWTAMDVFAYLYREDLPVHPAYAMSCGGIYDRRQLRVTPLCTPMSSRGGVHTERSTWEDTYWPDITGQTRTAPR